MKKIIAMLLVVAMVFSFVGCGNSEPEETIAPVITAAPVQTQAPEETEAPTTAPQETETPQETTSPTYVLPDRVGSDEDEEDSSDKVINLSSKDDLANLTVDDDGDYSYKASESDVEGDIGNKSITFESETSGTVTIDVSEISEDVNVVIDMPNAHVETTVITTGTLTATTSATTLVLLDGSSVGTLVIEGGNVEIQAGSEVEINTYGTIASGSYIFLEAGGKIKGHETLNGAQTMDYAYNTEWAIDSWTNHADTSWYSQDLSTFEISTAEELAGVAKLVNDDAVTFADKTITIAKDIDLSGKYWIPIGYYSTKLFYGDIDGGNNVIANLTSIYGGFIGRAVLSEIKDLTLDNIYTDSNSVWTGGFIGIIYDLGSEGSATIDNCSVSGYVEGWGPAGFVSYVNITNSESSLVITNSTNNAEVYFDEAQKAAGFVNYMNSGTTIITDCVNNGNITNIVDDDNATAGGFISYSNTGQFILTNCVNYGTITAKSSGSDGFARAGGIAGMSRKGTIDEPNTYINCENYGYIYAESSINRAQAGGIIGEWQNYNYIENAKSYGNLEANVTVAGYSALVAGIVCSPNAGTVCDIINPTIGANITMMASAVSGDEYIYIDDLVAGNNGSAPVVITSGNTLTLASGHEITIRTNDTLTIEEGATLIIEEGATFTNNGTLVIYGTVVGEEYITGDGSITQS